MTVEEVNFIDEYICYYNNEWAKENYDSFISYLKNMSDFTNYMNYDIDNYKDEINFYLNDYKEYDGITEVIDYWCSNGRYFDDWFRNRLQMTYNDYSSKIYVTRDVIVDAIEYCAKELSEMKFKHVIVDRAFTENEETQVITVIPCDGVEVIDTDGNLSRLYANDWEISEIYIPDKPFDDDKYESFSSLQSVLIKMLKSDFDKEQILYCSGW